MIYYSLTKYITVFILLFFTTACVSKDEIDCRKDLEEMIANQNIRDKLIKWVDMNLTTEFINISELTNFYNIKPGYYSYKDKIFDWNILGFDNRKSKVNLIGINYRDYNNKKIAKVDLIDSLFFAERTRYGILVKRKGSAKFVKKEERRFINVIDDRIALYCKKSRNSKSYHNQ